MRPFDEELRSLIKAHLRHSLCAGPASVQTRVYLDDEEISNLRSELPQRKELSLEEIESCITDWAKDFYGTLYVEPTDHQRTMAIKMARAIEAKVRGNT